MDAVLTLLRGTLGPVALACALLGAAGGAAAQPASESAVKAAFLYKFLGYIDWPPAAFASAEAPYVIGVAGADDIAAELERLVANRAVNGRRVVAKRLREGDPVSGLHVLFIGRNEARWREMLRAAQRAPVLTVTDTELGLDAGSVVSLVLLDDRVGFEVSTAAAGRAGLTISSRMLGVARRVVTG